MRTRTKTRTKMSDMSERQIAEEFLRQVKLCSGIGSVVQFSLLLRYWKTQDPAELQELMKIVKITAEGR